MFVCYIDSPASPIPHMKALDADDWREAVAAADSALQHYDRAEAAVFDDNVLVAIIDRARSRPAEPLPISKHPVFANMPSEVQIAIGRHGVNRSARSGDAIPHADEVVFVISGALTTLASPTGPLVELIGPGEVRGLELGLEGGRRPAMSALLDCCWIGLAPQHLRQSGTSDWLLRLYAYQALGRQKAMAREIACFANHTLDRRAADFLLRLQSVAGGERTLRVGQALIASALGVQRTSLSAVTTRLQAEQLVKIVRCSINILDTEALCERACGCWSRGLGERGQQHGNS